MLQQSFLVLPLLNPLALTVLTSVASLINLLMNRPPSSLDLQLAMHHHAILCLAFVFN